MKKILFGLLLYCSALFAGGATPSGASVFEARQTLNGLSVYDVFIAPWNGIYYINGQLTLPQISTAGCASQVVSKVYTGGGSLVYTGSAGATGFYLGQMTLSTGNSVWVGLTSSSTCDNGLNTVKGVVSAGNAF
jgi:hypothetical protein